jgi:hypothetical protein
MEQKQDPEKPGSPAPAPKDTPKDGEPGKQSEQDDGTSKSIKDLQRIISEKDTKLQEALKKVEESESKKTGTEKEMDELKKSVEMLTVAIQKSNLEKEIKNLEEYYPDIEPTLLAGKTEKEIAEIVTKQRARAQKVYGDSVYFREPNFKDANEVEKAKKDVIDNKKLSGENSALSILKLNREKQKINR